MAVIAIPQVVPKSTGSGSGAQKIDGSLNFDGSTIVNHLTSYSPGSNGNRTTWTWSAWVKTDPTHS